MKLSRIISLVILFALFIPVIAQDSASVTLTETRITWQTVAYELNANHGIIPDSLDSNTVKEHTFTAYILENEFLKVTLVPEFGGRIISMIYKPTGHEQLYQNPLGLPYGIGDGNFYYDWLMVYGGIFPTLPAPEHGKAWFLPWSFEAMSETPEAITVKMSFVDNVRFDRTPSKFNAQATGMEADFIITLKANRQALDTQIVLHNPTEKTIRYEYWTCVTLAPGSNPQETLVTDGAEIIAPVDRIKMPPWWPATTAQEESAGIQDVYNFDNLRFFKNWADMGIAYAYPDMQGKTFWGVINHDNEEGLLRVSDNLTTPGLKLWTWGYDSVDISPDMYSQNEARPYIEMWAGVTPEFFKSTTLAPNAELTIKETYVPTVRLNNVTDASTDYLANFYLAENQVHLQVFSLQPDSGIRAVILADSEPIYETTITGALSEISTDIPENASQFEFRLLAADETVLLSDELTEMP